MNEQTKKHLDRLAELKLEAGITDVPQWAEFEVRKIVPVSESMFAKEYPKGDKCKVEVILHKSDHALTPDQRLRKKFLVELGRLVDSLKIEHAPAEENLSAPLQKKEIAKKLGITVRQLTDNADKYPLKKINRKLYRAILSKFSPSDRDRMNAPD